jgi:hypothetical protein
VTDVVTPDDQYIWLVTLSTNGPAKENADCYGKQRENRTLELKNFLHWDASILKKIGPIRAIGLNTRISMLMTPERFFWIFGHPSEQQRQRMVSHS